jgi:hypothetical protein
MTSTPTAQPTGTDDYFDINKFEELLARLEVLQRASTASKVS